MTSTPPIRAYVCAPDAARVAPVVRDLIGDRIVADGSADPRGVRGFAEHGLDVLLVADAWTSPSPDRIAQAVRSAVGDHVASVLLTASMPEAQDGDVHDVRIRYPVAARVLQSRVVHAVRSRRSGGSGLPAERLADVEVRAMRMHQQNHYELLGVREDASLDTIKQAYDDLSLRLHPDRLRALPSDELREKGTELYVRITDAYRTLRSMSSRAQYNNSLRTGQQHQLRSTRPQDKVLALWELSGVPQAQKYLRLAQQALASGDRNLALVHLRFAATLDAGNDAIDERIRSLEEATR